MKVNIQKFQGGGFATFTPIIHTPKPRSTSKSSEGSDDRQKNASILDDDIFKELLTKGGLTNEVNEFVEQIIKLENSSFGLPYLDPTNRSTALRMIAQVNALKSNEKAWSNSYDAAGNSGGLDEVAVNGNSLYVKDENGQVSTIGFSEFNKVRDKVRVLSVAELLNERRLNPNLIGRNDIFDAANSSIGIEKINQTITDLVSKLTSGQEDTEGVYHRSHFENQLRAATESGVKPSAEEMRSLNELAEWLKNPSEYFKVQSKTEVKEKYLQTAYNYLWKAIGSAGQQKLSALAVINGENDPTTYIKDMLLSQAAPGNMMHVTPVDETGGTGSSGSGASGEKNLTNFQLFHKDKLMSPNLTFAMNDPKNSALFRGTIGGVSPIITPDGQNVGMTTIGNILNEGYNQFLESDKVYFGNKKVAREELNTIIYDGNDAAKVYMPVKGDGTPDYEALGDFKQVYAVYEANKDNWSVKQAEDHFKKNHYNFIKIDEKYENGEKVKVIRDNDYVKPFLVMYGYTNDATNLTDGNEDWITKLTSEQEDLVVPSLEQIWTVKSGKKSKNFTPSKFWNIEEYYSGIVAIPYRDNHAAVIDAMSKAGPREKTSTILDVQRNIGYSSNQPLNTNTSSITLK